MDEKSLVVLHGRIARLMAAAQQQSAMGSHESEFPFNDQVHKLIMSGVKSPEQLEDELLGLFIWVWSVKDHLKEICKANLLDPQEIEDLVNRNTSLQFVSDIANRAKHGELRTSRSGKFAGLVDVGLTVPQDAISGISVGAFHVAVDVSKPVNVELHARVRAHGGFDADAFAVLADAISTWEVALKQKGQN